MPSFIFILIETYHRANNYISLFREDKKEILIYKTSFCYRVTNYTCKHIIYITYTRLEWLIICRVTHHQLDNQPS